MWRLFGFGDGESGPSSITLFAAGVALQSALEDEDMSPTRRQELRASPQEGTACPASSVPSASFVHFVFLPQDPPGLQRENGIVTLQATGCGSMRDGSRNVQEHAGLTP